MRGLWAGWRGLLSRRETGEALAAFRILIGIGAVWSLVVPCFSDAWLLCWTSEGYREGMPSPGVVAAAVTVGVVAGVALVLGASGRVAAFVVLQVCIWVFDLNPYDGGAHDRYIKNGLWLLVLADSTASWSLACRWRTGSWVSDRLVPSWPRYVAVFQIVLIYWATGVQKVSPEWTPFGDFTALWYILRSPVWMRFDYAWLPFGFTQFATAATWFWEWGAPVWLFAFWARDRRGPGYWANRIDLRTLWALWGIGMHFTLFFIAVLGPLQWITVAWYAALFHPDEYRRAVGRLAGGFGGRRVVPAGG